MGVVVTESITTKPLTIAQCVTPSFKTLPFIVGVHSVSETSHEENVLKISAEGAKNLVRLVPSTPNEFIIFY